MPRRASTAALFPPSAAAIAAAAAAAFKRDRQGNFSSTTGLATLVMMLVGRQVFQKYGWGTAAKATPVVLAVTGVRKTAITVGRDGHGEC